MDAAIHCAFVVPAAKNNVFIAVKGVALQKITRGYNGEKFGTVSVVFEFSTPVVISGFCSVPIDNQDYRQIIPQVTRNKVVNLLLLWRQVSLSKERGENVACCAYLVEILLFKNPRCPNHIQRFIDNLLLSAAILLVGRLGHSDGRSENAEQILNSRKNFIVVNIREAKTIVENLLGTR